MKTRDGANFDAVCESAVLAFFCDNVGHGDRGFSTESRVGQIRILPDERFVVKARKSGQKPDRKIEQLLIRHLQICVLHLSAVEF
ncbi:MAG: hypothetical protein ACI8UO_004917 [Verrucomicrobiales bacterium]